jgi:hypothetical protein
MCWQFVKCFVDYIGDSKSSNCEWPGNIARTFDNYKEKVSTQTHERVSVDHNMCCIIQTTLAYFQAASGVPMTICKTVRGLSYRPWVNGLWFSYFFIC